MKTNSWFSISLVLILPIMFFTASCSKKAVKTEQAATIEPEVQKEPDTQMAPDQSAEEAAAREAAVREDAEKAFVNEKVHFAYDSSDLSRHARQILSSQAEYLRTNSDISVTVEGYCDDRGTDAYNMALGERRAESVKDFLIHQGIGPDRLNTVSYGEERPVAMGQNEAAWAQNRRAQFVIN